MPVRSDFYNWIFSSFIVYPLETFWILSYEIFRQVGIKIILKCTVICLVSNSIQQVLFKEHVCYWLV